MGKVVVMEYLTLDGVMEAPEAWQFPYYSEDVAEANISGLLAVDALLLGRVTYEIFADHWPKHTNNEFGVADKLNSVAKYVISTTLDRADWNNTTLIRDNMTGEIQHLKQQTGGSIAVIGSATLVQSLMQANLVDEYQLQFYPVVRGSGKRLFDNGMDQSALKLLEARTFSSGVVHLSYQAESSTETQRMTL